MAAYRVTAGAVVAQTEGSEGSERYFYRGSILSGVSAGEAARLLGLGLVETVEEIDSDGAEKVPAKSASKADWEAYARAQGATDEDLDGKTKDDLVATYGDDQA